MAVTDILDAALARLDETTREYAEHLVREWVRNLPTALAVVEALEMKAAARKLLAVGSPKAALVREVTRLEAAANRVVRELQIPADAVFGGEEEFARRWLGDTSDEE